MASLFKSTRNTRFLPGTKKYIRSDVPVELTEEEIQWLLENDVRTIIDLRTPEEIERKHCLLEKMDEFVYFNMSVTGGSALPKETNLVATSYVNMVDEFMMQIIEQIEESKTKVLFFCNAGKDRTGVVSALLLLRIHATKKAIIEDYLLSADNLREMLQTYANQNPSVDVDIITPHTEYMEEFLDKVSKML